jgi:hypothetical protein
MTATAHTLVAGAIATAIPDPYLAATLSLTSHFVLDSIPHWDFGTNWRNRPKWATGAIAITETLLGMTIAYFVYAHKAPFIPLAVCIVLSILPDWMEAPWYIFFATPEKTHPSKTDGFWAHLTYGIYKAENRFHSKAQAPLGIITQIVTVAFFMILLG